MRLFCLVKQDILDGPQVEGRGPAVPKNSKGFVVTCDPGFEKVATREALDVVTVVRAAHLCASSSGVVCSSFTISGAHDLGPCNMRGLCAPHFRVMKNSLQLLMRSLKHVEQVT